MKKIDGKKLLKEIRVPKNEEDRVEIHPIFLENNKQIIIDVTNCNIYDYVLILNYLYSIKIDIETLVLIEYEGKILDFKDWYC
ncbi:MAG: hypothetical protein QXY70_02655 [Nanopusillaceae archaeon]